MPQVRKLSCAFTTAVGACMCGPGIPCDKWPHWPTSTTRVEIHGTKALMFDGATERFTNNDAANALLKPAYRKHYRIPDAV